VNGSAQGIDLCVRLLLEPGDEVVPSALDREHPVDGERRHAGQRDRAGGGGVQFDDGEREHAAAQAFAERFDRSEDEREDGQD